MRVTATFLDPEPTSKLGLLVGGGIATTLAGGSVLFFVALARVAYRCTGRVEQAGGMVGRLTPPVYLSPKFRTPSKTCGARQG